MQYNSSSERNNSYNSSTRTAKDIDETFTPSAIVRDSTRPAQEDTFLPRKLDPEQLSFIFLNFTLGTTLQG